MEHNVWLDTLKRTSRTIYENRGWRYRKKNNHTMLVYVWAAPRCLKKRVLDIGCGKGDGMNILSLFAKEIWGIDFGYKELKFAIQHHFYCPTKIIQMDVDKGWLDNNEMFDVVVCLETLEHLHHPEILLSNLKNSCKTLIFSVPRSAPAPFHHQIFNSLDDIKKLVEPYFDVEWYFERKGIISDKPFLVTHRYIGVGTPKQ